MIIPVWIKLMIATGIGFGTITTIKRYWKNYPDDNPVEEYLESYVESQTGLDIDFTPESPEKNK